jgi:adenylosuccinate lyase
LIWFHTKGVRVLVCRAFSRGRHVDKAALHAFIDTLDKLPVAVRAQLRALTPATYLGVAAQRAAAV